jgi:hypothetical protein
VSDDYDGLEEAWRLDKVADLFAQWEALQGKPPLPADDGGDEVES